MFGDLPPKLAISSPAPVNSPMTSAPIAFCVHQITGLRRTGWGVASTSRATALIFVACGSVESSDKAPLSERLRAIHDGLASVLADHAREAAVERPSSYKDGVETQARAG